MIRLLGIVVDLPIFRVCQTLAVLGYTIYALPQAGPTGLAANFGKGSKIAPFCCAFTCATTKTRHLIGLSRVGVWVQYQGALSRHDVCGGQTAIAMQPQQCSHSNSAIGIQP